MFYILKCGKMGHPPTLRFAAHLLLQNKGKILLQRRFNTGYSDGKYGLVSGHVEKGEKLKAAMKRESLEEAGIKIREKDMEVVNVLHLIKEYEAVQVFLRVNKWQGKPTNMEPDKCDRLEWFPLDRLPSKMVPYVRYGLSQIKKGNFYSEYVEK